MNGRYSYAIYLFVCNINRGCKEFNQVSRQVTFHSSSFVHQKQADKPIEPLAVCAVWDCPACKVHMSFPFQSVDQEKAPKLVLHIV